MKKQFLVWVATLAMGGLMGLAQAQTALTPKAQFTADSKAALTQYNSDKALCAQETTSGARLQCKRDAKAEYDKAVAAAKAKLAAAGKSGDVNKVACAECGKVTAVNVVEKEGEGGAVGIIAGGVAGAVLGHQVGSGLGKDLATIAGAAGGAYAGKKIEEKVRTRKVWQVGVQYSGGSAATFEFEQDPGFKVGDAVKKSGNSIVRN